MTACLHGNLEAAKLLVTLCGADYRVKTITGHCFIMAVEAGRLEIFQYLLSLPDSLSLNEADLAGLTPLYLACYYHKLEVVNFIL